MKYYVRRISVWSVVKITFLLNGIFGALIGLFIGFILLIFSAVFTRFGGYMPPQADILPTFAGGVLSVIFLPVFYGFMLAIVNGIIITAIVVWLYNILAGALGGVEVELEATKIQSSAPPPPKPKPAPDVKPVQPSPTRPEPEDNNPGEPPKRSEGGVDV
ncbi:MAG: hypothetical protein GF307_11480 [candidate division Zixibacteria bacterium]|nr:hypothetical protein [candidate division Zixibacteria bacterium]